MTGWAAFWIFLAVFFIGDTWLYWKGHDTFFWKHKTEAELRHQKKQLGLQS